MRCLTLADALQSAGADCRFICRNHPGHLIAQIRRRGFTVSVLLNEMETVISDNLDAATQSNYTAWLGVDWATDAEQSKVGAGETAVDWLIVDHYALDARWEQTLRPMCRKLMVIDDLADRPHDCDLLLDQNLGRDAEDYRPLVPAICTILAGPQYSLLRPEFAALREESLLRRVAPQLRHLLIALGGVDQADATSTVLESLKNCDLPLDLHITVVMGAHAPWLDRVQALAKQMPRPTAVKTNVSEMARLMTDSDLAIGAAGGTSWERCCLGLPTVIVVVADNQRAGARALEQMGCAKLIESVSDVSGHLPSMLNLMRTTTSLQQFSQRSCQVTDGCGASRVRDFLVDHHG